MIKKLLKNNTLLKNTGIYTISSIINAGIPFLMLPILTRYLTPEDYGLVSMFTLLVAFTSPFIGLSVNGAISRQYFNQEEVDIWRYVGNCIIILVLSTVMIGFVYYFFADFIVGISSFPKEMLWVVVVFSLVQFLANILLVLWQIQKKALNYSIFVFLKTSLNFSISILLVVGFGLGWKGRIFGQFFAVAAFAIFSVIYLIKSKWIKISYKKEYFHNAVTFGIPLIPHALSGSIISMTDRLFITNMVGLSTTGIYSVGYQIGSIMNILTNSFNNAYIPWLYERLKIDKFDTKVKIVKFTYLYFALLFLFALCMGLVAPTILNYFLGNSFTNASSYVLWISLGYAFNGMYLMVVNYIFYAQKTKFLAMVTFITAALNIVLNYIFIGRFGAIGAAQATTVTFAIKFIFVWIVSSKIYKMPWRLKISN